MALFTRQLLLRKKAAEELKKEQERKSAERRRIIVERCGEKKPVDGANEGMFTPPFDRPLSTINWPHPPHQTSLVRHTKFGKWQCNLKYWLQLASVQNESPKFTIVVLIDFALLN